jgi:polysaccharide pyruvyl transferase WcaK-like protein
MSDIFFDNIKNIRVTKHNTNDKELDLKFTSDFNNRFISIEYNKKDKTLHSHLSLIDNIDHNNFNYLVNILNNTNDKNINQLHELLKDWFEVEAIKTLTNVKELQEEQSKLD